MAESTRNQTGQGAETEEEEDYMGDLSQFLPLEPCKNSKRPHPRKASDKKTVNVESSRKKSKTLSWQERRKVEKERKQIEEDEQTLARIEAPISESNIGFKLLKQMGYMPGSALGKEGSGRAEPVSLDIRRSRAGIGREDPHKEKKKREEIEAEQSKRKEEELMADFGSRQKTQWRTRRVVINFWKAKAALDQLENKDVVPEKNNEEDDEGNPGEEEEEEEEVTEEDLEEILMKLRDEYRYCPFCGFQYETMEALLSNCPGIDEDDH